MKSRTTFAAVIGCILFFAVLNIFGRLVMGV